MYFWNLHESLAGDGTDVVFSSERGIFATASKDIVQLACAYFDTLVRASGVNAELFLTDQPISSKARGNCVYISKKMMDAVKKDKNMFAFVCAYELVNVTLGKVEPTHKLVFDIDLRATQYMSRAGFDPAGAIRLLTLINQGGSPTHPSSRARIEALNLAGSKVQNSPD